MSYYSSRSHTRHMKGYLWICLLVSIFGTMMLWDNGISLRSILPTSHSRLHSAPQSQSPTSVETISEAYRSASVDLTPTPSIRPPVVQDSPQTQEKPLLAPVKTDSVTEHNFGNTTHPLYASEIVVLVKTGATALWRRLPMHLATTLSRPELTPNIVIYSDALDRIAGHTVHDSLANVSDALKASADFEIYRRIPETKERNLYLESAAIEGDFYLGGAWRLDKYKFLPLVAHAAKNYRNMKWFVYMEDDNYYFWHGLFSYLASFSSEDPMLIGSPAARLGEDFVHGGSGFAISAGAMKKTFWADEGIPSKWESYAKERCCGDQVLSHAMSEMGVERYKGATGSGWFGLQSNPDWRIGFGDWNWCSPLLNVHKVHQADVSRLDEFERDFLKKNPGAPLRYADLFKSEILPNLIANRTEWDNYADSKVFTSTGEEAGKTPLTEEQKKSKPWYSVESCIRACEEWEQCLSWKYRDDSCGLSFTVARGMRIEDGTRVDSGWMLDRIKKLSKKSC